MRQSEDGRISLTGGVEVSGVDWSLILQIVFGSINFSESTDTSDGNKEGNDSKQKRVHFFGQIKLVELICDCLEDSSLLRRLSRCCFSVFFAERFLDFGVFE
jgi:hypothetical protein